MNDYDAKKFYTKLYNLDADSKKLIRKASLVSNKDIEKFLETQLRLIHKGFYFKGELDTFLKEIKSNLNHIYLLFYKKKNLNYEIR